jgi:hypothetical protein
LLALLMCSLYPSVANGRGFNFGQLTYKMSITTHINHGDSRLT